MTIFGLALWQVAAVAVAAAVFLLPRLGVDFAGVWEWIKGLFVPPTPAPPPDVTSDIHARVDAFLVLQNSLDPADWGLVWVSIMPRVKEMPARRYTRGMGGVWEVITERWPARKQAPQTPDPETATVAAPGSAPDPQGGPVA